MDNQQPQLPATIVTGELASPELASLFSGQQFRFVPIGQLTHGADDRSWGPTGMALPDLIVVAQPVRQAVSQDLIDQLGNRFPTIPMVMVLGSWCEGETRSGRPAEAVHRVDWHKWHAEYALFCQQWREGQGTLWHRPVTETRADRLVALPADGGSGDGQRAAAPIVVVQSQSRCGFLAIDDVCRERKWRTIWLDVTAMAADQCPAAAVIDSKLGVAEAARQIGPLRERFDGIPIVILAGFVRQRDNDWVARQGTCCSIVSKPFDNLELVHALDAALHRVTDCVDRVA